MSLVLDSFPSCGLLELPAVPQFRSLERRGVIHWAVGLLTLSVHGMGPLLKVLEVARVGPVPICALPLAVVPVGKSGKSIALRIVGQEGTRQGCRPVLALSGSALCVLQPVLSLQRDW